MIIQVICSIGIINIGISPYRLNVSRSEISLPPGGIYVSFGSTGTKNDRVILKWITQELIKYDFPVYKFHFIGRLPGPAYDIYQNSRLVISHGGYNTVLESLYFGCPVLLIPNIAADRMEVARRAIENGYGHCINYYLLDPENFHTRIKDLLENPKINKKTKNLKGRLIATKNYQTFQNQIYTLLD